MSGICGIVFHDNCHELTSSHLIGMVRALDVSGQGDGFTAVLGSVGVGSQKFPGRLAGIGDLTLHEQPLALAFHGSLYNLRLLFPSEKEDPDPLKDLIRLYVKEGMGFLQRLRGEFVIALWDGGNETLYLATDRFRVHPLFYYQDQEKLVFASRMKSILACPFPVKSTINPEAIIDVVNSSMIPTPKTIFHEFRKLPPGHLMRYRKGEIKLESYWKVDFLHPCIETENDMARKFKKNFAEAVSVRLQTDEKLKDIGTFLSGGVDSSTVTGVLTQILRHPVKSFSIGFNEQRFNEINYARIAARAFGAEHYEYFVTPEDTYEVIPTLIESIDEPFANASVVPTYFCAKVAKEHGVDVLYAGDGGDELFAGNERYATQRLFEYYHRIPKWPRERFLRPLIFSLADGLRWELFIKGKKYIQRASLPYYERITSYDFLKIIPINEFVEESLLDMVGRDYNPYEIYAHYYFQAPAKNDLDRHLYIDWMLTLGDNDLIKVTRMTEAAGVTVRYPFLDHRVAEFSTTIPAHIKMKGLKLRSFQKKAYADFLPLKIRQKEKHGFGLPIPIWLRTDKRLNEMMRDLILSPRSIQRGYFRKKALEELIELHRIDETSFYGTVLWNLIILEMWLRHFHSEESLDRSISSFQ